MMIQPVTTADSLIGNVKRVVLTLGNMAVLVLVTAPAWAQEGDELTAGKSPLLSWGMFLAVFVVIWFIFYKGLYPLFLKYFNPDYCKDLFWSLFLLYSLAWLHLSLYTLFDYGFFYPWLRWVAVFLAVIWIIWFTVVTMARRA